MSCDVFRSKNFLCYSLKLDLFLNFPVMFPFWDAGPRIGLRFVTGYLV